MAVHERLGSLTARLVLTAVALVAAVCLLIAAATTLAMHRYLSNRLDEQVRDALVREASPGGPGIGPRRFSSAGTLRANFPEGNDPNGFLIVGGHRNPHEEDLDEPALDALREVPSDGAPQDVDVPEQGEFRVVAEEVTFLGGVRGPTRGVLVVGLPTGDFDETIASLIGWEILLTLLGVTAAATAGLVVVRRQLRPLREVAATAERVARLPLASGAIELTERVPAHLTDEGNEVGQVGASLNTLLAHVESSLEARHRSEQQVRQFVADASHELRTPLTTIKGYAELARRRPEDARTVLTALDKVESESVRMTSLVEDLLLLARLDSGRPLERASVDLTRLLLEAVSDARVLAPDHHWRLDLPDTELHVVGDEQRLHQLVTNLLTNARKHTPPGTTVTVAARDGALTVHDDGPGFPADLVPTAFERFARADTARTRTADSGAGLGLALVQAIATAHGGSVSLASVPGDTNVTVRLPRADGPRAAQAG
jgi:two-component system, OmpR family, sensor kinase